MTVPVVSTLICLKRTWSPSFGSMLVLIAAPLIVSCLTSHTQTPTPAALNVCPRTARAQSEKSKDKSEV